MNQAPRYGNDDDEGIARLTHLVRGYLIVRVAGYSDYFCDLSPALQDEIIARTEHAAM